MARTLHQAMAYLGLGQTEEEAGRQERRGPATVYEETVFEADDQYEDDYEASAVSSRAASYSAGERDVLQGADDYAYSEVSASPQEWAHTQAVASISASEADQDLLQQSSETLSEWELPAAAQRSEAPSPAYTHTSSEESSEELRQITTIHPRSYNDAKTIGASFRENIPVIINVTEMSENDAKRLIDFSSGLAFALNGHIERVTAKVFLLTPADLEVLGAKGTEVPVALDSDDVSPFNQV